MHIFLWYSVTKFDWLVVHPVSMEAGEDQTNSSSANSSAASGGNSRPTQIAQMSLYERQAVQVGYKATANYTYSQIQV